MIHLRKRHFAGGWAIVLRAHSPERSPSSSRRAPPQALEDWYRHRAGCRPEHALRWTTEEAVADAWVALLDAALR